MDAVDDRFLTLAIGLRDPVIARFDVSVVFAEVAGVFRPWLLSGRNLGLSDSLAYRSVSVRRARLGGPTLAR